MVLTSASSTSASFNSQLTVYGSELGSAGGAVFLVDPSGNYHRATHGQWSTSAVLFTVPTDLDLLGICSITVVSASGGAAATLADYLTIARPSGICDWTAFPKLPPANNTLVFGTSSYNAERTLYASLVNEGYMRYGINMTYFVVTYNTSADKVWGEDNTQQVVRQFPFLGYTEMPGEDRSLGRYGLEDLDTFTIYISRLHFAQASTVGHAIDPNTGVGAYSAYTPKVGDIIKIDSTNILYEISFRDESGPADGMFLQGQHVWELVVRPYRDRHRTLSPTTSASLSPLDIQSNKLSDIRDNTATISTRKASEQYTPKANEQAPNNPFAGW